MEDNGWLQNSTYDGDCVSLVYTCNPNILGEIGCTATYLNRFTACTESLNFVCIFRGIQGDFPVYPTAREGVVVLSNDYILTEFYISNKVSNVNGSDDTCLAKLSGGKTFSLSTSGQIALLNKYVGTTAFSDYTEQQVSFSGDLESLLFWVDGLKDKCVAARFVDKQGAYTVTFTSWPCDQDLLVLCQVAKILPETPVPRLKFDSPRSNIIKVDNEIQMPSSYYLNINPVRQTTPAVRLYCVTAPLQPPFQTVVIYANQIPVQTSSGVNQTLHEIQLYRNNGDVYPTDQGNIYYRCEINDANDNRVLKSNSVFIRLIDQEIYAVHIPLNKTYDYTTRVAWMLHKATLIDNWFTSDAYYGFNENIRLNLNEITTSLQRITTATGFTPVPKLFIADNENPTFIFYVKRTIPNNFTINNLSKANYDKTVNALESSIKMLKGNLSYFDVGSVQVFSIDWCWNTSIQADAVGLNVTLPRSRIGTVWSSAQLCAQDGQPILTVRCNGNKKVGLSWSKIRVNPLCDYSRVLQNKTNITHILETVSQQNITSINVTTIIDAVKNLTSVLKNGTTTSIDIVYLADILQKSTQVANLSSDTVQGIMDMVSNLKRFSRNLLQESNQIGNATNRLLKSMDHLGKQIASQTEGGLHHQRLISGGLGLDVWDFANAKNLTTIIGLKVLSGGETAVLSAGELISLFTKENLHYNAAEVAIILPREFIEQFQANGSSLRLSMNVYKDTTLFTSIQDNNNRTLNSKVIAAQILLDSQQISDLSPYNVTTVFLPSQQLPPKARTNLTTCVYWSFTENSGAGGWSSDGCMYQQTIEGRDICVCDHLTNFAVLLSFNDQESMDQENQLALSIISIIGLSLSIIGLSLSILSFLLIK
ncbi:uncharacterized protein LOC131947752 [Physella acuta]|uniref:uncharacterized protein LOC131947752 n=1 Tax=Physella acuta TaxID=109671 RepID=UPI0027DE098B|nr:uncharacterized protein LOC131947752 [Physella acuta]